MHEFPLLDLEDLYHEAYTKLCTLEAWAAELYADSDDTWAEMAQVRDHARSSLAALGILPPGVLQGIAQDRADLAELEDRADAASW